MNYIEPLFRPPSEARSLILQVTNGCSWNQCTFCEMYTQPQKRFRMKPLEQVDAELATLAAQNADIRRVFLADGDAMTLSTRRLVLILERLKAHFPDIQRVSSYLLPRNAQNKSVDDFVQLRKLGLSLFYVGCESGDDLVLERISKGETFATSLAALSKIKQAGSKSSVMILNGMAGRRYWEQHAKNSARLMNAAQPDYLSTLVISFPQGMDRYQQGWNNEFEMQTQQELFTEMRLLIDELELSSTIFRSDHASNYLALKGVLGKDKQKLLATLDRAINDPASANLRQEWQRGL